MDRAHILYDMPDFSFKINSYIYIPQINALLFSVFR